MATPKKKETDYRAGSALLKKQLAERSGKPVVLPSKKNVVNAAKQIGGAALTIAGPGKVVKGVQAVAKVAKAAKTAKAASKSTSSRQAGDYPVSGSSAKKIMPKTGKAPAENYRYGRNSQISKNVSIKDTVSPSGKEFIRGGASQVMNQNARLTAKVSKAEAKANARGLKAANKPVKSKDADLINRNNPYARQAILNEKPARANRTRLGKDAFKSK
jgi:hypothetical protein